MLERQKGPNQRQERQQFLYQPSQADAKAWQHIKDYHRADHPDQQNGQQTGPLSALRPVALRRARLSSGQQAGDQKGSAGSNCGDENESDQDD